MEQILKMGYDEYAVDEGKSAKFNAGVLQTQRINKILDLINFCKNNPLAFNMDQNDWNFNIILRCVNNLFDEIEGFMKRDESKICVQIKERINKLIIDYPIIDNIKRSPYGNPEKQINESNWRILQKALDHYERLVRRYGIKYQILSATKDDFLEGL